MPKQEYVPENETHKILWDFEIQLDDPIPTRRRDLALINKKNLSCVFCSNRSPRENKKKRNERQIYRSC